MVIVLRQKGIIIYALLIAHMTVYAQTGDSLDIQKKWNVNGYLKDIQSFTLDKNFDSLVTGNLIHNRVNVRWKPTSKFTAAAEFRTRLFWGEEVRMTPDFASNLQNSNEAVNMSILWFETESAVMQTNIDRLWLEYNATKWDARVGRQRINWGINTIWNPNDIFNTYNFLDFDYEERPGRDAVKFRYHLSGMSNIELAVAGADQYNQAVGAIRYLTNKWNYDFQFSAGVYHEIFTLGAGWSGSIAEAGFKVELQYFSPHSDTTAQINVTLETDYVFENAWYVNLGILVNSAGLDKPINDLSQVNFQLSPQQLMPTKWNIAVTLSKEITPLFSSTLSVIYCPGTNLAIFLPSIKYNLAPNLDFDLIWQSFYAEQNNDFEGVMHRGFLRMKWNF